MKPLKPKKHSPGGRRAGLFGKIRLVTGLLKDWASRAVTVRDFYLKGKRTAVNLCQERITQAQTENALLQWPKMIPNLQISMAKIPWKNVSGRKLDRLKNNCQMRNIRSDEAIAKIRGAGVF